MAELTRALDAAFRARFDTTPIADAAIGSSSDDRKDEIAVQEWLRAIHSAFYAPAVRGQSGNKFLELETTLTHVLQTLSQGEHGATCDFAQFMVRVVLLLCQEPTPSENGTSNGGDDDAATLVGGTSSVNQAEAAAQATDTRISKKLRKKSKNNAQPNTPLAFIVVNALKNLTLSDDSDAKQRFQQQGQTNAALIAFCTKGLDEPSTVVRSACILY